jgi:hypothetical protein
VLQITDKEFSKINNTDWKHFSYAMLEITPKQIGFKWIFEIRLMTISKSAFIEW